MKGDPILGNTHTTHNMTRQEALNKRSEDFSPKGGPKDAVAKWDGDGIVFPAAPPC